MRVRVHVCMHCIEKPLFSVLQTTTEFHFLAPIDPEGEHLAKATQTQNLLGTPKRIATIVVNTLFAAIVEATNVSLTVPEKMRVWFKAYRYMYYTHAHRHSTKCLTSMHACVFPPPTTITMHTQRLDDFISSEEECL